MERITKIVFSMRLVSLGLFVFLAAIGIATFIESMHGVQAAKIVIYNAHWFTVLLVYLSLAMIFNIIHFRMWKPEKIATLSFHVSFLIIMIGAAITRYTGYEGLAVIREGTAVDYIYTADPKLLVSISDPKSPQVLAYSAWMSDWGMVNNSFSHEIDHGSKVLTISYKDFISNAIDTIAFDQSTSGAVLDVVVGQMKSNYLAPGDKLLAESLPLSYGTEAKEGVTFKLSGEKIQIKTAVDLRMLPMTMMMEARRSGAPIPDSAYTTIPKNTWVDANLKTLYQSGSNQFVLKNVYYHAYKTRLKAKMKNQGADYLTVNVSSGKANKTVVLKGGHNMMPDPEYFEINGMLVQLEYGSVRRPLPFSIFCKDFKLSKYPGSESPSSFESFLSIHDPRNNYKSDRHVFMNHVTDYDGYRFFQSAYELDNPSTPENEEATKLSVNHDAWGTNITYLGYLLMAIGMILSLFAPKGRFRALSDQLGKLKKQSLTAMLLLIGLSVQAQHGNEPDYSKIYRVIDEQHSEKLATLLVQEQGGRIMPMHTLCDQLLRKIHGEPKFEAYNAVQTILSLHMYGKYWMKKPMILVPMAVRERLKLKKYCAFNDLIEADGAYKFQAQYAAAHGKAEKFQDEFEKKLIKLTERFEVFQGIISWQYMRIIPKKNDANNKWFVPMSMEIMGEDSISSIVTLKYLAALDEATQNQDYSNALFLLGKMDQIQRTVGKSVVPSRSKVALEIRYNSLQIFKSVYRSYLLIGLLLLVIFIASIFGSPSEKRLKILRWARNIFLGLSALIFIYHATGLGFRWYISGHAPWSNGYEAIVFIAWVTVLAGWAFLKKIEVVMPMALILSAMMLFVSELNLLDPEITPLVPVLKSYWLMIHVAIITGSYGFLGLSFVLSLLNLSFYLFQTKSNTEKIQNQIAQITGVSEMTMTMGVFMLTIGTFLGGIWANESWGRYWGWDPKETWALVSVLVYAIILHFRFIPALKSTFTFNLAAFWGYSAILFTYFGVNFMLVGLHSYAQGDGIGKFPTWLVWTIVFFIGLSFLSWIRNRRIIAPSK
jgi:cytochrome c-type biogenesis protein CcsB